MGTDAKQDLLGYRLARLPLKLQEQIKACPVEGQGNHQWLFKTALSLRGHLSEAEEIAGILRANLSCDRPEREIDDAVENSGRVARGKMPSGSRTLWPAVDYPLKCQLVRMPDGTYQGRRPEARTQQRR
jgi:hypothetical protein